MRAVVRRQFLLGMFLSGCGLGAFEAHAQTGVWVVTSSEAALPLSRTSNTGRCVTRGPAIRQISPLHVVMAGQPFRLKIDFVTRGGEKLDPHSVQIGLLRGDTVDITSRIRPYMVATGVDVPNAMIPAGTHVLQIAVSDTGCHKSTANIELEAR